LHDDKLDVQLALRWLDLCLEHEVGGVEVAILLLELMLDVCLASELESLDNLNFLNPSWLAMVVLHRLRLILHALVFFPRVRILIKTVFVTLGNSLELLLPFAFFPEVVFDSLVDLIHGRISHVEVLAISSGSAEKVETVANRLEVNCVGKPWYRVNLCLIEAEETLLKLQNRHNKDIFTPLEEKCNFVVCVHHEADIVFVQQ